MNPLPFSTFLTQLKPGNVEEIAVHPNFIQGNLRKPREDGSTRAENDLAEDLAEYDVRVSGVVENTFFRDLLGCMVPAVVFFAVWMFLARKFAEKNSVGESKEDLKEIVSFLKEPKVYGRLGARISKGILLVGPPGIRLPAWCSWRQPTAPRSLIRRCCAPAGLTARFSPIDLTRLAV